MKKHLKAENILLAIIAILGMFSFAVWLAYLNIADNDIWARLAQGASVWKTGGLMHQDIFAFTPVLAEYIDHEWGAGLLFFSFLKFFGPTSLLFLKIILGVGAVSFALVAGRAGGTKWPTLLLIAIPVSYAVFPGYTPVIRSHTFTYMFFGITLFCLEEMRKGKRWPAFVMIIIMAMWANIHGGFVSGLGIIAIYAIAAILARRMVRITLATLIGCVLVTFANPYGIKLWQYLIPALLHQRSTITEWQPMPLFGFDIFVGFRILFIFALVTAIVGWRNLKEASSPASVIILLVTAYLGFRHKRHAPFFALAAAAFLGPYLEAALGRIRCRMPASLFKNIRPILILFIIYSLIAAGVALFILPDVSFQILVHAGFFPVRATDILMYSKASGNLVIPLEWGSYAMWRLYPRIKISMCGRYETIYPASTFQMNQDFFLRSGENWDRLCRQYKVDFIILNLTYTRLRASDIDKLGFGVVWSDGYSALFAREGEVAALRDFTRKLPYQAAQTFDDRIPDSWWKEAQE